MPRNLTPETIAALTSRTIHTEYLFESAFESQTLRYWSGFGALSWDSKTWAGDGKFHGVSNIRDSLDIVANGISVSLPGISTEILEIALREAQQAVLGKVWLAFFDNSENLLDVDLRFVGNLDTVEISEEATSSVITFSYESRLIRFNQSREIRLSNEAQQSKYPGDKGFEQLTNLQNRRVYWGRADPGRLRV